MSNQNRDKNEAFESSVGSRVIACSVEQLSPDVRRRRAEMLGQLQVQMAQHHEGRRRRRVAWSVAVATACLLALAASVIWMPWGQGTGPMESIASSGNSPLELKQPVGPSGAGLPGDARLSSYVSTNAPDIVDRLVFDNREVGQGLHTKVEVIDDAELVQLFAETGISASVGIIGGHKAVIVSDRRDR